MPTVFSHAVVAVAIGKWIPTPAKSPKFWLLCMLCAMLPDADVLGFKYGIPYHSMWGHRGFTHSIFFGFLLGGVVSTACYSKYPIFSKAWCWYFLCFSTATISHGLLDACTSGGLGIAYFAPFSAERYFWTFRPIQVSPLSISRFFSNWGVAVMKSEFVWLWLPSVCFFLIKTIIEKNTST